MRRVLLLSVLVLLLSVCVSARVLERWNDADDLQSRSADRADYNTRDLSPRELRRLTIEDALDREEEQQHAFETESSDMGWNSMYGIGGLPSNLFNYPGYAPQQPIPYVQPVPVVPAVIPSAKAPVSVIPPYSVDMLPFVDPCIKDGPTSLTCLLSKYSGALPTLTPAPVAPLYPGMSSKLSAGLNPLPLAGTYRGGLPSTIYPGMTFGLGGAPTVPQYPGFSKLPVTPAYPSLSKLAVGTVAPLYPGMTTKLPVGLPVVQVQPTLSNSKLTYAAPIVSYAAPIMEAAVLPPNAVPVQSKTAPTIFQPDYATAPLMTVGAVSAQAPTIHKGYGTPVPATA